MRIFELLDLIPEVSQVTDELPDGVYRIAHKVAKAVQIVSAGGALSFEVVSALCADAGAINFNYSELPKTFESDRQFMSYIFYLPGYTMEHWHGAN